MSVRLLVGDCREQLRTLPDASVHCCVTSPPYYGLRDYGVAGQIGLEPTVEEYVAELVAVFREVRRVLRDDGTLWLNLGDSYNAFNGNRGKSKGANKNHLDIQPALPSGHGLTVKNLKNKDLIGVPWRVAFALQADGWWLRSEIIWHKPNPMPESVTDRPTKAHEQVFLLAKGPRYYYDADAIAEPSVTDDPRRPYGSPGANELDARDAPQGQGRVRAPANRKRGEFKGKTQAMPGRDAFRKFTEVRNARSVWTIPTQPFSGAHFAVFPAELARRCVLAGCPGGGTVLDPFAGSGTTGMVADREHRDAVLVELSEQYAELLRARLRGDAPLFAEVHG